VGGWLAFGPDPFWAVPGAGGLVAGGLDGVGGAVVLAGLPDDRVAVVLAGVVDCDTDPQGPGGLAVADRLAAEQAALVSRHPKVGVEPVEGLLGLADGIPGGFGVWVNWLGRRVWSWRWRASRSPPKPLAMS
jgi:hypothetical protein